MPIFNEMGTSGLIKHPRDTKVLYKILCQIEY